MKLKNAALLVAEGLEDTLSYYAIDRRSKPCFETVLP